jgi:hypothetical protein
MGVLVVVNRFWVLCKYGMCGHGIRFVILSFPLFLLVRDGNVLHSSKSGVCGCMFSLGAGLRGYKGMRPGRAARRQGEVIDLV